MMASPSPGRSMPAIQRLGCRPPGTHGSLTRKVCTADPPSLDNRDLPFCILLLLSG